MSVYGNQRLIQEDSESQERTLTLKSLKEKMSNINRIIESLLSKKIRIDLEIKKQKIALKNLKREASKEMKVSLKLESLDPLTPEQIEELEQKLDSRLIEESILLDQEMDRAEELLRSIQKLEEQNLIITT